MIKSESLVRLAAGYDKRYDDDTLDWLTSLLEDVTDAELEEACRRAAKANKFMPSIAELRELVMDERAQHPQPKIRKPRMTQAQAWEMAVKMDREDMGMTEEQYELFKRQYKADHGEEWTPSTYDPNQWNADGTQKGFDDADEGL